MHIVMVTLCILRKAIQCLQCCAICFQVPEVAEGAGAKGCCCCCNSVNTAEQREIPENVTLMLNILPVYDHNVSSACKNGTYQYNALWAMNERAQERCRRVTCTCHVG